MSVYRDPNYRPGLWGRFSRWLRHVYEFGPGAEWRGYELEQPGRFCNECGIRWEPGEDKPWKVTDAGILLGEPPMGVLMMFCPACRVGYDEMSDKRERVG